jgi:serpin B
LARSVAAAILTLLPLAAQRPGRPSVADDARLLADSCNRFAASLHQRLATQGKPTCSPGSIAIALWMLLPGAGGTTQGELRRALELPPELSGERLLAAAEQLLSPVDGAEPKLRIVNDLWVQNGFALTDTYVDALRRGFGGEVTRVDFNDTEAARQKINAHIARATNDRIRDLLQADAIDKMTRVVLTNALWFRDAWEHEFSKRATADQPFRLESGDSVDVPMMHVTNWFLYAAGKDFEVVAMPFAESGMRLEVVVPTGDAPLAAAERTLLAGEHLAALKGQRVRIRLPRFRTSASHELAAALQALGVRDAFDPRAADFTAIDPTGQLFLSQAVHKVWIDVDERGAEAAAATALVLKARAAAPNGEPIAFDADRPFAFALRDQKTGMLWFVGRVEDPRSAP